MLKVIFILADGSKRSVDMAPGETIKEAAVQNMVPGIMALCGGTCTCGTCHVYVDKAWRDRFAPPLPEEDALLDGTAAERRDTSRLSCQLPLTEEHDGVVVTIPELQQ
ncbi:MAG: protein containing Ferredoxin domain [Nevskia sp.]|nr:protein containing Ferredoxin domain [Nevskia sp.]